MQALFLINAACEAADDKQRHNERDAESNSGTPIQVVSIGDSGDNRAILQRCLRDAMPVLHM